MDKQPSPEEQSKDLFFQRLEGIAREMIEQHGKEFAMGALVLAARWIAEGQLGKERSVSRVN